MYFLKNTNTNKKYIFKLKNFPYLKKFCLKIPTVYGLRNFITLYKAPIVAKYNNIVIIE